MGSLEFPEQEGSTHFIKTPSLAHKSIKALQRFLEVEVGAQTKSISAATAIKTSNNRVRVRSMVSKGRGGGTKKIDYK